MSRFYEDLKSLIEDVESFLTETLEGSNLSEKAVKQKDDILNKLQKLQSDFPQLKSPRSPSHEIKRQSSEIYADVDAVTVVSSPSIQEVTPSISGSEGAPESTTIGSNHSVSALEISMGASMSGHLTIKTLSKTGVLDKLSNLTSAIFGKQFCVLNSGLLYIFSKLESKKCKDIIDLRGYDVAPYSETSKKEFSFRLTCPGKASYLCCARNQDEVTKWIKTLNTECGKPSNEEVSTLAQDDDSEGEDYEIPTDIKPPPALAAKTGKTKPPAPPFTVVTNGEIYDDGSSGQQPPLNSQMSEAGSAPYGAQEVYDDCSSQIQGEIIEEDIYESCDDIQPKQATSVAVLPARQSPARNTSNRMGALPPTPVVSNGKPTESINTSSVVEEKDYGNMFYGVWDCPADADNEIGFHQGDIITILSKDFDNFGWWVGRLHGKVGLVPSSYLTPAYELVS